MTRLVLWDIDGTLVDGAGLGRDAFLDAFEQVVGSPATQLVPFAGRTDLEIALDLLETAGVRDGEVLLERFHAALAGAMAERAELVRERGRALPGAHEALQRMGDQPGVLQSLLTGNIEANAWVKLGAFGLDRYLDFEVGAYGSDHRRRGELVAVALRKAREVRGLTLEPADAVLIGDTPLDVAAALEGGARAVAVASGPYGEGELREAGAHAVLADLTDVDAVVEAVLGR
jgi:phosphoglycolate phosphatase-like HAD superfamily hydrolase